MTEPGCASAQTQYEGRRTGDGKAQSANCQHGGMSEDVRYERRPGPGKWGARRATSRV